MWRPKEITDNFKLLPKALPKLTKIHSQLLKHFCQHDKHNPDRRHSARCSCIYGHPLPKEYMTSIHSISKTYPFLYYRMRWSKVTRTKQQDVWPSIRSLEPLWKTSLPPSFQNRPEIIFTCNHTLIWHKNSPALPPLFLLSPALTLPCSKLGLETKLAETQSSQVNAHMNARTGTESDLPIIWNLHPFKTIVLLQLYDAITQSKLYDQLKPIFF